MATGLQFITMNPAAEAMRSAEQRTEQRRAADLAARTGEHSLAESQRQSRERQAVDAAIREGMAEPPAAPVPAPQGRPSGASSPPLGPHAQSVMAEEMRAIPNPPAPATGLAAQQMRPQAGPLDRVRQNLARTPGGGSLAMQLEQERARRQDAAESQVVKMLSSPATAELGMQMAAKIGMQVPPNLMRNSQFWQGMDIGKQLYGDDPAAGQKFIAGFMSVGGGDIETRVAAGTQAAGPPRTKPRGGTSYVGADGNLYFLGDGSTRVQPITGPDGQPFKGQKAGGAGAKPSVYELKHAAWLAAHPGDVQGALEYAGGRRVATDAELRKMAWAMMANEFQGTFGVRPEVKEARGEEIYQQLRAQQTPAAPAPAAAPAAGGQQPPQTYREGGITGTFTGQMSPDGKPIYATPDGRRFVVE